MTFALSLALLTKPSAWHTCTLKPVCTWWQAVRNLYAGSLWVLVLDVWLDFQKIPLFEILASAVPWEVVCYCKIPCIHAQLKSDLIISAGTSGRVLFWNCQTGELEAAIQAHNAAINALSFHDGRFFTASRSGISLSIFTQWCFALFVIISADELHILCLSDSDMTVREWDLVTMTPVRSLLKGHKAAIQDFQVSDHCLWEAVMAHHRVACRPPDVMMLQWELDTSDGNKI